MRRTAWTALALAALAAGCDPGRTPPGPAKSGVEVNAPGVKVDVGKDRTGNRKVDVNVKDP